MEFFGNIVLIMLKNVRTCGEPETDLIQNVLFISICLIATLLFCKIVRILVKSLICNEGIDI